MLPTMPISITALNLTLCWTLKNVSHKIWKEGKGLCGLLVLMHCFIMLLSLKTSECTVTTAFSIA